MFQQSLIVFSMGIIISFAKSNNFPQVILKTNEIFKMYHNSIEKTIPFKEVRASLQALDRMAQDYKGKCRQNIYEACQLGYQATDNYYKATDQILQWTLSTSFMVEKYIPSGDLGSRFPAIQLSLHDGLETISNALKLLEETRDQLTTMQSKLRPIPQDLTDEFNNLKYQHDQKLEELKDTVNKVSSMVLDLAGGPVGSVLGLFAKLVKKDIASDIILSKKIANEKEQMEITQVFYNSLRDTVRHASVDLGESKENLHEKIREVTALQGNIFSYKFILEEAQEIKDCLVLLKETLNEFIRSHEYAIKIYHGLLRDNGPMPRELQMWTAKLPENKLISLHRVNSIANDLLSRTAKEREDQFWKLEPSHSKPSSLKNNFISYIEASL